MNATSPAPTRATTSFTLSFGLINIPVSLYTATVETKTVRHEYTADGHSVGRKMYDKETGAEVEYSAIVKSVEHDGVLVPLSDDEIAAATGHESGIAPIVGRISVTSMLFDFVTEKVYQLRPKNDKKVRTATERAFTLLMSTLEASGEAALIRVSIRGAVARWGAVTSDGTLRILHSVDQVRAALPMPEVTVTEAEAGLAKQLLDAIPTIDVAAMVDDSSERVAEYVASKAAAMVAGGEAVATVKPEIVVSPVDLVAQMLASIEAAKAA